MASGYSITKQPEELFSKRIGTSTTSHLFDGTNPAQVAEFLGKFAHGSSVAFRLTIPSRSRLLECQSFVYFAPVPASFVAACSLPEK